jgi:hypothetical protein
MIDETTTRAGQAELLESRSPTAATSRARRLGVGVGLGALIVVMITIAVWLTFIRTDGTEAPMDMQGGTMGASVCAVLPAALVDQVAGDIAGAPSATSTRLTTTCVYRLGGQPGGLVVTYAMEVSPRSFAASVDALGNQGLVMSLAHLGDSAAMHTGGPGGRTTVLVHGDDSSVRIDTTAPGSVATRLARIIAPEL